MVQREQLESSFVKATRYYSLAMVEPLEKQSGVSTTCIIRSGQG